VLDIRLASTSKRQKQEIKSRVLGRRVNTGSELIVFVEE
jgi:hypothetical protein